MPHKSQLLAASTGTVTDDEHPLISVGTNEWHYRGFEITHYAGLHARLPYYAASPLDLAERRVWETESDEPDNWRLMAQALECIDTWLALRGRTTVTDEGARGWR